MVRDSLANQTDKRSSHIIKYLGNNPEYFEKIEPKIVDNIFDYRKMNDYFGSIYVKMYDKDTAYNDVYLKIITNLQDKLFKLNVMNDSYSSTRRIKKEIEKYIENNRVNDFSKLSIYNTISKDLSEYMIVPYARIIDYDYKINHEIDTNRYLGNDSPLKKIYTLNKVNPINEYPAVSIAYEFNGLSSLNIFQTKFVAEKFEVYDVVFYDENGVVKHEYSLEKLRDNICLTFQKSIDINKIVITYYIITPSKLDATAVFSVGESIYSNKNPYSDIIEYGVNITGNLDKYIIDHSMLEKFSYIPAKSYQYTLPSINEFNQKYVSKMYYFTQFSDLVINLFPFPKNISTIKVSTETKDITDLLNVETKVVGSGIFLKASDLQNAGISIGSKLFISYETSELINNYYESNHIINKLIYSSASDKVTSYTDGASAFNTIVSLKLTDYYLRKKNIIRDGKQIEVILYDPTTPSDYRDVINTKHSTKLYLYKRATVNIESHEVGDVKITLPEQYMPGCLTVFNEELGEFVKINYLDWVDAKLSVDTDKDKAIVKIENPGVVKKLTVYYYPLNYNKDDVDLISNINITKNATLLSPIVNGVSVIDIDDISYDKTIMDKWILDGHLYKHPEYSYVYYELVTSNKYEISKIDLQGKDLYIIYKDESINDNSHMINCYPKDNSCVLNLNYKYILPESNPVIIVE